MKCLILWRDGMGGRDPAIKSTLPMAAAVGSGRFRHEKLDSVAEWVRGRETAIKSTLPMAAAVGSGRFRHEMLDSVAEWGGEQGFGHQKLASDGLRGGKWAVSP